MLLCFVPAVFTGEADLGGYRCQTPNENKSFEIFCKFHIWSKYSSCKLSWFI